MYEVQIRFGNQWVVVMEKTRMRLWAEREARAQAKKYPQHAVRVAKVA